MTRTTTGHPTRALRGVVLLLILWLFYRAPAMLSGYEAAVAAAARGPSAAAIAHAPTLPQRTAPTIPISFSPQPRLVRWLPHRDRTTRTTIIRRVTGGDHARSKDVVVIAPIKPPQPRDTATAVATAPTANDFANAAYTSLAGGDRRGAVRLFDAALASGGDPRSGAWRSQRDALTRRWSGTAYSSVRAGGTSGLAIAPVLGGGQSGAALGWTPYPLATRPLALTLRGTIAHDGGGRSALAAVGIAWHPFTGITVAAERLLPVGPAARGDWALRVAGGISRTSGAIDASAYGEAGAVGTVLYSAAQAHLGATLRPHGIAFGAGIGGWASVQRGYGRTVDRLDLGPGITVRSSQLSLSADYRFRVAGNAAPGSGPVLTLAAAF